LDGGCSGLIEETLTAGTRAHTRLREFKAMEIMKIDPGFQLHPIAGMDGVSDFRHDFSWWDRMDWSTLRA
jgi:hypothetical protein